MGARVVVLGDEGSVHWAPWGVDVMAELARVPGSQLVDRARPVAEQLRGALAVLDLTGEASPELAEAASGSVRLWQFTSVGTDHFDVAALLRRDLTVANVPGATSATGLAELALMLGMLVLRRYREVDEWMRSGEVQDPTGSELKGRTLLIVGLGASGTELAKRAVAFGMTVTAVRRKGADPALAAELGLSALAGLDQLDELLRAADVVSLHVPLVPETARILGAERIRLLKPGAVLVNVSRGGLIDEPALLAALDSGAIAGAGLDVLAREPFDPADPLLNHPRVVATPHIAGQTFETSRNRARFAVANVERVLAGEPASSVITRAEGGRHHEEPA
jgi:phosphoglycerate dehydrogenase-like enzyme